MQFESYLSCTFNLNYLKLLCLNIKNIYPVVFRLGRCDGFFFTDEMTDRTKILQHGGIMHTVLYR